MDQTHPAMTVARMDAGVEPPWMVQDSHQHGARSLLGVSDPCL